MSDIVRRGKIVIDFETGDVAIKVPDLTPILDARKKELSIAQELEALYDRINKATAEAANRPPAMPGGGGGPGDGGGGAGGGPGPDAPTMVERLKVLEQLGSGFLRVARAAVLFGMDADDSMRRVLQSLATVQAGIDLFKGSIAIIKALAAAKKQAAAASAAMAAAQTAETAAQAEANAVASSAQRSLMAMGVIITGLLISIKLWRDHLNEVAEAERLTAQRTRERTLAMAESRAQMEKQAKEGAAGFERSNETPEQKLARFAERAAEIRRLAEQQMTASAFGAGGDISRSALLNRDRELAELAKERRDVLVQQGEQQSKLIEQRERELELAQKLLTVEQDKVESFQAQFGALTAGEQARLRRVAQKAIGGEELSRRELEFLEAKGGDEGESLAFDIKRKKGIRAGAADVFTGRAGNGLAAAQAAFDQAKVARDSATGGQSSDAALALIRQSKEKTEKEFGAFMDNLSRRLRSFNIEQARMEGRLSNVEAAAQQAAAGSKH